MNIKIDSNSSVRGLARINIILGKNGVGKSTLLRNMQTATVDEEPSGDPLYTSYITPERGGVLLYQPNIEENMRANSTWMRDARRSNQFDKFREQSSAQFRGLEISISRDLESLIESGGAPDRSMVFQRQVEKINTLLENLELRRDAASIFKFFKKGTEQEVRPASISSGEAELVALAIETLVFSRKNDNEGRPKFLLLDEPDVHLHPDLQVKLMRFINDLAEEGDFYVVVATHSTAILGALENQEDVRIGFMQPGDTEIDFKPIKTTYKKFLPVFGAHPLSNVFNEAPVLIVEGEDDERVWQTVVRASDGRICLYPCSCDGVPNINIFEDDVIEVIGAVYESAIAYSLRDRDDADEGDLTNKGPIIRFRLKCRAAENLFLADEVISSTPIGGWEAFQAAIEGWLLSNPHHSHFEKMNQFKEEGFDRRHFDIKDIRNLLVGLSGDTKSWETIAGRCIASLEWGEDTDFDAQNSIFNYLGEKIVKAILPSR